MLTFALIAHLSGGSDPSTGSSSAAVLPLQQPPIANTPNGLALNNAKSTLRTGGRVTFPGAGLNGLTGLKGQGGITSFPKHNIVLQLTSASPISYAGYLVPTSQDRSYGVSRNPGTSWSLSTIGYGPPDYAQIFSAAGRYGATVTCTVTVDGRVTDRRSTDGPYSQLFCQG